MPTAIAIDESEKLDTGLTIAVFVDPVESARAAGLRYVMDDEPGIRRRKRGKGGPPRGGQASRRPARQPAGRLPQVLRPPGGDPDLPGGEAQGNPGGGRREGGWR